MEFWESIEKEIFENSNLDIYEKMCLLVLMSQGEEVNLSSVKLANYMGCGLNTAKRAFDSLRIKGYLSKDYQKQPAVRNESNVVRTAEAMEISKPLEELSDEFQGGFFTTAHDEHHLDRRKNDRETSKSESRMAAEFNTKAKTEEMSDLERRQQMAAYILGEDSAPQKSFVSKKVTNNSLIDQVIELVDEKISSKEANIILAFANQDIDLIKKKYKIAKLSQVSDTISVLINELQKKESNVIRPVEALLENNQIDTNRLIKMQAYQNNKFNK